MPELRMAKASLHVKRHLTPRELATIRCGLVMVRTASSNAEQLANARVVTEADELISDDDIDALVQELAMARRVKVCRTKTREA